MEILNLSLRNWAILCGAVLILSVLIFAFFKIKNIIAKILFALIILGLIYFTGVKIGNYKYLLLYWVAPSFFFGAIGYLFSIPKKRDELWDIKIETNKGDRYIDNVKRGVTVFGAAGAGKTESVIYKILKHFSEKMFGGIIYDFKKGELTEIAIPLFKERLKIIACADPQIGVRTNVIHPQYINGEKDINQIVSVVMSNLIDNGFGKGDDFFKDSASSLFSATVLKFWLYHKEYCTLPHVISFLLSADFSEEVDNGLGEESLEQFAKLKKFLTDDPRVAIQASPFLLGLASARQTASVISTLANALRKLSFPEMYWTLSGNDIDFNINDPKNNIVISVINEPESTEVLSPINALIIHMITKQMMKRHRQPSFLVLDEAPTIRLLNMAQLPATMRSFGVAVIYCAQDIVQGNVKYGKDGFLEIISNLSTQFFGKSNSPVTSKFYESYFELIKEKTKSVSRKGELGNGFSFGDNSVTIGEREVSKVRAQEFRKFKPGEFAFISDEINEIVKIKPDVIIREDIPRKREITDTVVYSNYQKIMKESQSILQ